MMEKAEEKTEDNTDLKILLAETRAEEAADMGTPTAEAATNKEPGISVDEQAVAPVEIVEITGAQVGGVIKHGGDIAAGIFGEKWRVTDEEAERIGNASIPVIEKRLPTVARYITVEAALVLTVGSFFFARLIGGIVDKESEGKTDTHSTGEARSREEHNRQRTCEEYKQQHI
jgi:hypothetical protein